MDREEVAHELRTPMTTIKGVLRLLSVGRLAEFAPEDAADLLERAWQQFRKLEDVVAEVEAHFSSGADTEEAVVICEEAGEATIQSPSHDNGVRSQPAPRLSI